MPDPEAKFADVDRVIHEPARLAILAVLSACRSADFQFLQSATGLTKGNLSVQLTRLQESSLIRVRKEIVDKKMRTTASLSSQGAKRIAAYWRAMERMRGDFGG